MPASSPAADTATTVPVVSDTPAATASSVTIASAVATVVLTDTVTATGVLSSTFTPTMPPTATATMVIPSPTDTPTMTATHTAVPTSTATQTSTPSYTATSTPAVTMTATRTPTSTNIPLAPGGSAPNTATGTPLSTGTPAVPPTSTATNTDTASPTATDTGVLRVTDAGPSGAKSTSTPLKEAVQTSGKILPTATRATGSHSSTGVAPARAQADAATASASLALDLAAPAMLGVNGFVYTPQPFEVKVSVHNQGKGLAKNVRLTLDLPKGLSLASGTVTQAIGSIQQGAGQQVAWQVAANWQTHRVTLRYSVHVLAQNAPVRMVQAHITVPSVARQLKAPRITISPARLWSGDQLDLTIKTVPGASILAGICCVQGSQPTPGKSGDLWMRGATADQNGVYAWRIENLAVPVDSKVQVQVTISGPGAHAVSTQKSFIIRFNAQNGAPPLAPHGKTTPYNPAPGMGYMAPQCTAIKPPRRHRIRAARRPGQGNRRLRRSQPRHISAWNITSKEDSANGLLSPTTGCRAALRHGDAGRQLPWREWQEPRQSCLYDCRGGRRWREYVGTQGAIPDCRWAHRIDERHRLLCRSR